MEEKRPDALEMAKKTNEKREKQENEKVILSVF